jgi:putative ABC transport system ATP-binding protein
MADPIIQLENVNFRYNIGKSYEVQAMKDINIEIDRGEYVAFFGPSGSGKTTLLYLISGVEPAQDGKILINGRDISKFTKQELAIYRQIGVGMIFQQFNLIPSLTVLNNVALPMSFLGISQKKRQAEGAKLLKRLGIENLAVRYPHELSGGQQQRVGIARALANNAPIIIADEPLGNLDSENSKKVLEFLKELHEKDNRTIIMVTHEAWSLRDVEKIFYIKDGQVIKTEKVNPDKLAESVTEDIFKELAPQRSGTEEVAHMLSGLLLRGYTSEESNRFQFYLNQRLTGRISYQDFLNIIDKPYRDGGVGLWKQKARKISAYVEDVINERKQIAEVYKALVQNPENSPAAEVIKLRQWLLSEYDGSVDQMQQIRLDELLMERLRKIITEDNFKESLILPKSRFGVGLSLHSSQHLSEKLELALEHQDHA